MEKKLFVFTDGGARGNPGPAAIGVVIKDEKGKILTQFGKKIGQTSNNVAEYTAVIEALRWIKDTKILRYDDTKKKDEINHLVSKYPSIIISFFLDSRLVVNQLNGFFKIKDANLRELLLKTRELEGEIGGNISYKFIPREKNRLADSLVNETLDY